MTVISLAYLLVQNCCMTDALLVLSLKDMIEWAANLAVLSSWLLALVCLVSAKPQILRWISCSILSLPTMLSSLVRSPVDSIVSIICDKMATRSTSSGSSFAEYGSKFSAASLHWRLSSQHSYINVIVRNVVLFYMSALDYSLYKDF